MYKRPAWRQVLKKTKDSQKKKIVIKLLSSKHVNIYIYIISFLFILYRYRLRWILKTIWDLWFCASEKLGASSKEFFFWKLEKSIEEETILENHWIWRALHRNSKCRFQGSLELQQISTQMVVYSTRTYMYWQFLWTILADVIAKHPDIFHKFSLRTVPTMAYGQKCDKFNPENQGHHIWIGYHIICLNYRDVCHSQSYHNWIRFFKFYSFKHGNLPFIEVVILHNFAEQIFLRIP